MPSMSIRPYNTKTIVASVERVFNERNIDKLTGPAYRFIINHMRFIADFNLGGFKSTFEHELARLCGRLAEDHHLSEATRRETDAFFIREYTAEYNKSVADTLRGIHKVANKFCDLIEMEQAEDRKQAEIAFALATLERHGVIVTVGEDNGLD